MEEKEIIIVFAVIATVLGSIICYFAMKMNDLYFESQRRLVEFRAKELEFIHDNFMREVSDTLNERNKK